MEDDVTGIDKSESSYALRREKWKHEDNLINHRVTWLLASQSLLFAAYAGMLSIVLNVEHPLIGNNRQVLLNLVQTTMPLLGFFISLLVLIGIIAAGIALMKISSQKHRDTVVSDQLDVSAITTFIGWLAAAGLPLTFLVAWSSVACNVSWLK